jgi:hypothetical protein
MKDKTRATIDAVIDAAYAYGEEYSRPEDEQRALVAAKVQSALQLIKDAKTGESLSLSGPDCTSRFQRRRPRCNKTRFCNGMLYQQQTNGADRRACANASSCLRNVPPLH